MVYGPGSDQGDGDGGDFATLPRARRRHLLAMVVLRTLLTTAVLILAYALLPFTLLKESRYVFTALLGLLLVVAVLALQFWQTLRSPYPRIRATEAVMTSGPLFIVMFATMHYLIGALVSGSYTQPMTRLDALYYTVTTFATVGYGDISPVSQVARLVALLQMVFGLLLVGVIARLLFGIAQSEEDRRVTAGPPGPSR